MPGSFIAELVLQPIVELVFEVGGYYLGRIILPVISLGRWKCDPLLRDVPKKKLKWSGTYHVRGERVYLTWQGTAAVGILFATLLVVMVLLWVFALKRS